MENLPRNVFTTCPKEETSRAIVPKNEFNIYAFKGLDLTLIMIAKPSITMDDIVKAAKCVALESYFITKLGSDARLMMSELPIKDDIVIHKKTAHELFKEYKIFDETTGMEVMIVKGEITIEDMQKAVKCTKIPLSESYVTLARSGVKLDTTHFPMANDIVIRRKKIPVAVSAAETEYKIFDYVSGRELMIVKGAITITDTKKAVKCARIHPTEAYFTKSSSTVKLIGADFPIRCNIVIHKEKKPKRAPEVFHICESTSVAPVRKSLKKVSPVQPVVKVSAKRKLIKAAIKGLQHAIEALNELEAII